MTVLLETYCGNHFQVNIKAHLQSHKILKYFTIFATSIFILKMKFTSFLTSDAWSDILSGDRSTNLSFSVFHCACSELWSIWQRMKTGFSDTSHVRIWYLVMVLYLRSRDIPVVMVTSGGYQKRTARIIADSILNLRRENLIVCEDAEKLPRQKSKRFDLYVKLLRHKKLHLYLVCIQCLIRTSV